MKAIIEKRVSSNCIRRRELPLDILERINISSQAPTVMTPQISGPIVPLASGVRAMLIYEKLDALRRTDKGAIGRPVHSTDNWPSRTGGNRHSKRSNHF